MVAAAAAAVAGVEEPHAVPGSLVRELPVVKDAVPAVLPAREAPAVPVAAANLASRGAI